MISVRVQLRYVILTVICQLCPQIKLIAARLVIISLFHVVDMFSSAHTFYRTIMMKTNIWKCNIRLVRWDQTKLSSLPKKAWTVYYNSVCCTVLNCWVKMVPVISRTNQVAHFEHDPAQSNKIRGGQVPAPPIHWPELCWQTWHSCAVHCTLYCTVQCTLRGSSPAARDWSGSIKENHAKSWRLFPHRLARRGHTGHCNPLDTGGHISYKENYKL